MRFKRTILSVLAVASGVLVAAQVANADEVLFGLGAVGDGRTIHTIDVTTAEATPIGSGTGYTGNALVFDPSSGQLLSVEHSTGVLITIDMTTGVGSYVADLSLPSNIQGLSFGPDGELFGLDMYSGLAFQLVTIHTSTGEVAVIGPLGQTGTEALAYDAAEGFFWATKGTQLFSVDPATGAATFVRNVPASSYGLAVDAAGTLYGAISDLWNFSDDTLVGNCGVNMAGLTFVPEPACLSMVALGAVIIMRRRRLA